MRKYISANIAIVRMHSNVIATSTIVYDPDEEPVEDMTGTGIPAAPDRRYRNGRYSDHYDQNYGL